MIKVKVAHQDKDKGWHLFIQNMRDIDRANVTVGVHESAGSYPGGQTVAEVAWWNEFGTEHSPERSFMRSALDENEDKINQWRKELLEDIKTGQKTPAVALEALGFRVQALIQNKITSGEFKPNKASTLAQKRRDGVGSMPLQWTRLMLRSIGFKVNTK